MYQVRTKSVLSPFAQILKNCADGLNTDLIQRKRGLESMFFITDTIKRLLKIKPFCEYQTF